MTKTDATPSTPVVKPRKDNKGNSYYSEEVNGQHKVYLTTKDGRQLENTADTADEAYQNILTYLKS
ncbi:hypothetical protein [Deinococcus actinosclerus]|uniref:Uncharacterized protein n=1 Tax=Deinococcus actinosclerus TaxID=1768108 RepID=A0ABN4K444_9DEIO|nr:hypothetical protein [Deinococcus actinosclerus]ALW87860.1 hypothetical protein AUC44_02245 [Deinococcus actinosclerus]